MQFFLETRKNCSLWKALNSYNNKLINVNTSNSSSGITIKNVQNVAIRGNKIIKAPVAAFSASPTSGYTPQTVKFTDKSTDSLTSWKWSFGDGTYSTQKNPSHTYIKTGKYTVSLTVKNAAGSNKITKSSFIVVNALKPPCSCLLCFPTQWESTADSDIHW